MRMLEERLAEATITLQYPKKKTTTVVKKAVSPDNYRVPEGIEIQTLQEGSTITITIRCKKGLGSLTATIDDLLACISTVEKTIAELD
jgi:hypothetical protein